MDVRIRSVAIDIGPVRIVDGVTLAVTPGAVAGVIGPNGSGKSTLLRSLYRHLRPAEGEVVVGDEDIWRIRARDSARRVAAVPQERPTEFDFTAREVVAMGRIPRSSLFSAFSSENDDAVERAMEAVGVGADLASRPFATLSGGERQRVLVARALVQDTPVLVLDEPTNHLDIRHQLELLELVRSLRLTTVLAIHDLNLAARYCDSLHVMLDGRLVASGPTEDVLTPDLVASVFGVGCDVDRDAEAVLRLHFRPLARHHSTLQE